MKKFVTAFIFAFASLAYAEGADLASGSKIKEITSAGEKDTFVVRVAGGKGACIDGTWIVFPVGDAASREAHARTYETLLAAFIHGKKVNIHSTENASCNHATSVTLVN